jgi:hypothetical protein
MSRFRFTIRRMMVVVAIVAVICGGGSYAWRREQLRRRLEGYHWKISHHSQMERSSITAIVESNVPTGPDELARLNSVRTAYHASMRRKYQRAAVRPWQGIEPDPPEPVEYSGPGRRVNLQFR